jgi:hypothetical protein
MNREMICKNCKYHYIEEISFDYPQSCCSKRMATTEGWCKCNDFEYSDRYIKQLQQENQQLKMINKEYERLNKEKNGGFKITNVQEYNIDELLSYKKYKDNWNKLREYIKTEIPENVLFIDTEWFVSILDKMQELEQGSDSNVKD